MSLVKFRVKPNNDKINSMSIAGTFKGCYCNKLKLEDWVEYQMFHENGYYCIQIDFSDSNEEIFEYKYIQNGIWESLYQNRLVSVYDSDLIMPIQCFDDVEKEMILLTFNLRMSKDALVSKCYLVGSFNDWNIESAYELTKLDVSPNIYSVTIELQPKNKYTYKYLTDKQWSAAELRKDRVLIVPDYDYNTSIEEFDSKLIIDKYLLDKTIFLENLINKIEKKEPSNIEKSDDKNEQLENLQIQINKNKEMLEDLKQLILSGVPMELKESSNINTIESEKKKIEVCYNLTNIPWFIETNTMFVKEYFVPDSLIDTIKKESLNEFIWTNEHNLKFTQYNSNLDILNNLSSYKKNTLLYLQTTIKVNRLGKYQVRYYSNFKSDIYLEHQYHLEEGFIYNGSTN